MPGTLSPVWLVIILLHQLDAGTSVRSPVHTVTCILSVATAVFLETGPQESVIDDNY